MHYSLPYFDEGEDRELQFREEDRPAVDLVVNHLLKLKMASPKLFTESATAIAAFADGVLKQEDMRIPCDARKLLWVGADGSVILCYVTFPLGNWHDKRLSDILYTKPHHQAAHDAFRHNCPNCHCEAASRVEKHAPSARHPCPAPTGRSPSAWPGASIRSSATTM